MALNITFLKSPHFNTGRKDYLPIAIVIHIMEGTLDGTDSWFQDLRAVPPVSAHFGIGKTGELHQYVLQANTAWHAGIVTSPSWKLIKVLDADKPTYIDPNLYTFGIEHEGFEDTDWTDATYQASSQVIAGLAKKWNIPLDRDHVIGHHEIYSEKACPGSKVDIDKLIQMALQITSPDPLIEPGSGANPAPLPPPASAPGPDQQPSPTPVGPAPVPVYNIYNKVVKSGKATTLGLVNIRSAPGDTQPVVAVAPANIQLAFDGYIDNGPMLQGVTRWYYTDEGNWYWSGAVK